MMGELLDDYLAVLGPQLPTALVGPQSHAALRRQFGALPAALTSYFGFECRLPDGDSRTDLQLAVHAGSRGQAILAGEDEALVIPEPWRACWQWRQVEQFAKTWRLMPASHVPHIWLGFDCQLSESSLPVPLLHIRTEKRTADEIHTLLRQAIGHDFPASTTSMLSRCFQAATPTYVGFMLNRSATALRITQPLPIAEALPYLKSIGWEGDRTGAARMLELIRNWTTHVGLSLNVGSFAEPYLGMECLNWTKPVSGRAAWRACLDELVPLTLCTVAKREALLSWPTLVHSRSPRWGHRLPTDSESQDEVLRTLACNLSHIKLVCQSGEPLQAKAYIDVRHSAWQRKPRQSVAQGGLS